MRWATGQISVYAVNFRRMMRHSGRDRCFNHKGHKVKQRKRKPGCLRVLCAKDDKRISQPSVVRLGWNSTCDRCGLFFRLARKSWDGSHRVSLFYPALGPHTDVDSTGDQLPFTRTLPLSKRFGESHCVGGRSDVLFVSNDDVCGEVKCSFEKTAPNVS